MKPKTLAMAVPTMIVITIAFGALFVYIEEKKYEALVHKKELDALKAEVAQTVGFQRLAKEIALKKTDTDIAKLHYSKNLNKLSEVEIANLVASQQSTALTEDELVAVKGLISND